MAGGTNKPNEPIPKASAEPIPINPGVVGGKVGAGKVWAGVQRNGGRWWGRAGGETKGNVREGGVHGKWKNASAKNGNGTKSTARRCVCGRKATKAGWKVVVVVTKQR